LIFEIKHIEYLLTLSSIWGQDKYRLCSPDTTRACKYIGQDKKNVLELLIKYSSQINKCIFTSCRSVDRDKEEILAPSIHLVHPYTKSSDWHYYCCTVQYVLVTW
jgi:hypothetical protein